MHIFLIRHGQSISNFHGNYEKRVPDHLVPLTEDGKSQAREMGEWLKKYCDKKGLISPVREFGEALTFEQDRPLRNLTSLSA